MRQSVVMNNDQLWEAVERRDRSRDGEFYFGVLTTGIYCRPSCPGRRPLRQNVRFYRTPDEAERDGLRACKRCRPLEVEASGSAARIRELCRYIETHPDESPDLADLAARAGLSRFHLQRSFKAAVGLTPKQYVDACRLRKLKQSLRESRDVAGAVYDAGYGSSSRVYERADTRLGMTPNQYRKEGRGVTITHVAVESPVGLMMIGATDRGLCSIQFGDSEEELVGLLRSEYPAAVLERMGTPHPPEFQKWMDALVSHLAGTQPRLELPLDIQATAFQMRVWNYLQSIPYGEVQSYGEVAAGIGRPTATRAVARACATNRVALAIPCHRVIRGSGEMGGYRWGLARKRALIDLERTKRAAS
jgi:AraC family transcriptional regulator, regulatory protein of adaptative response / methylated-DNA-[protein]-cysteine methyltransferase